MLRTFVIPLLLAASCTATTSPAAAQTPAATPAKPEFDVVSIKPNNSGDNGGAWGVSENRYRARNTALSRIILQAYSGQVAPSLDRLKNAPSWVFNENYDITAKVDDATANSWKGLRQDQQVALAAPLLRTMLEDRCKLVVHTVPTLIDGYALIIGKHGIKMKPSPPDEPEPPNAVTFEGGWKFVPAPSDPNARQVATFQQVTLAELLRFLSVGGKPFVDQTGLTGKYDLELPKLDVTPPTTAAGLAPAPQPDAAHYFDWNAIGLEMKPIKVPAVDLVIDHIERPSPN